MVKGWRAGLHTVVWESEIDCSSDTESQPKATWKHLRIADPLNYTYTSFLFVFCEKRRGYIKQWMVNNSCRFNISMESTASAEKPIAPQAFKKNFFNSDSKLVNFLQYKVDLVARRSKLFCVVNSGSTTQTLKHSNTQTHKHKALRPAGWLFEAKETLFTPSPLPAFRVITAPASCSVILAPAVGESSAICQLCHPCYY